MKQDNYNVEAVARACDLLAAFHGPADLVGLGDLALRANLNKVTAFRILATLTAKGLVEKVGSRGYRSRFRPVRDKRLSVGYAAQSEVVPFVGTVTESLVTAAQEMDVDLVVLNNRSSRKAAIRNAELLVERKVDVAIEFQKISEVAAHVSSIFQKAGIPLIAVDNPHPEAVYFGADNYKAGRMGGSYLGRWVNQKWRGQADEIVLVQSSLNPLLEARMLGIYDGIASILKGTSLIPVHRYDTKGSQERTIDVIRRHLSRSRSQHILIGTVNDVCALAATATLREFGREAHGAIVGQDAIVEARQEMRRPNSRLIGSVAYFPEAYGQRLIRLAMDMAENRHHSQVVFTLHALVTPENVDKIYPNDVLMTGRRLG
jgi:ribose transport system substrate-binding protein